MSEQTFTESFKVAGEQLVDAFKKLIHEGNVRRVVIKQGEHTVAEFPLTVGVVGVVLAPILAAIGAIAAVVTDVHDRGSSARRGPTSSKARPLNLSPAT
jgi:hypothetical protein